MMFSTLSVAYASEPLNTTPTSEDEFNGWNVKVTDATTEEISTSTSDKISLAAVCDLVMPMKVSVTPIVYVKEDNQYYVLNDEIRVKVLSGTTQMEYFNLSPSGTATYIDAINRAISANPEYSGKTVTLFGWHLECVIRTSSAKPKYLEVEPSATCLSGTNPIRVNIPYTVADCTVSRNFALANEDLTAYQYYSFTGGFYFTYASGNAGGLSVGTGFAMNYNT